VRLAICLLLLFNTDAIEYIVSENRYDIWEDFGPYVSTWITLPAFFLIFAWPVVIGAVSLFYCGEYS
jgi:pheromone a factor receptor